MLGCGEKQSGLTKVYAITSKDNTASQELLKKLGFGFKSYIKEPSTNEELSFYSRESEKK